jgi:NADH-quinone oxidoreductase subunit G
LDAKQLTVTIDGRPISVPEGTLVIRAAEQLGIYVPRFCDHPYLAPLGACRQCLVEVEGQRKPLTACTTTVTPDMIAKTQFTSAMAADAQEGVLELLLINHPLDCPMCDKGGECPLQDQALAYGPGGSRMADPKRRFSKPVPVNPLVYLDRERCVLCARCTRFASEISGDPFIELFERGALEQVAIFEDQPYDSPFSGNIIQICPVGALTSRDFRFRARPFDMTSSPMTCNHCASGCSLVVQERRGEVVRVLAGDNPATNDVWSCDVGRFSHAYVTSPDRLVEPLVRKGSEFVAVSWAEALRTARALIENARGAGPAAVLSGGRLADEDAYALARFARTVLGTNDLDARLWPGSEEEDAVLVQVLASGSATYADIDAAQVVLVAGLDPREESPILFLRIRKAARRGAVVAEVNARRTPLASLGGFSVQPLPGEEAEALASLAQAGSGALASIAEALRAAGPNAVVLAGERLASSPGALAAAWNLAHSTGAKFGWVPRKAGAVGALRAGLHPALLPGARRVADDAARAEVEALWGGTIPATPGRSAADVFAAPPALLVTAGVDPAADFTDAALARSGIAGAGARIALDLFLTETSRAADLVLPAASMLERDSTFTDWEGRAQPGVGAVEPAGLVVPDWEILSRIAAEVGVAFPRTRTEIQREMGALAPRRAATEAVTVPKHRGSVGSTNEYPFALVTYPLMVGGGTMTSGADELLQTAARPFVEINAADAKAHGLGDGDRVRITGPRGAGTAVVRVADTVPESVAFVPTDQPGLDVHTLVDLGEPSGVRIQRAG